MVCLCMGIGTFNCEVYDMGTIYVYKMGLVCFFFSGKMSELYVYQNENGEMNLTNTILAFWSSDLKMVEISGLKHIPSDLKASLITSLLDSLIPHNMRFVGWRVSGLTDTFYFGNSSGITKVYPTSLPLMDEGEIEFHLKRF